MLKTLVKIRTPPGTRTLTVVQCLAVQTNVCVEVSSMTGVEHANRPVPRPPRSQELGVGVGLLHPLLPHNMSPSTIRAVLHPPRVQDQRHGQQGGVQLGRGAAETRALAVVDVDAAVVLQVQALVEANRRAVHHAAPRPPRRVPASPVAAVGRNL